VKGKELKKVYDDDFLRDFEDNIFDKEYEKESKKKFTKEELDFFKIEV